MGEIPKIISVDDHVIESASVWQDRLPRRFRDRGPCLVRVFGRIMPAKGGYRIVEDRDAPDGQWADEWRYDDLRYTIPAGMAQVYALKEHNYHEAVTYDLMAPASTRRAADCGRAAWAMSTAPAGSRSTPRLVSSVSPPGLQPTDNAGRLHDRS